MNRAGGASTPWVPSPGIFRRHGQHEPSSDLDASDMNGVEWVPTQWESGSWQAEGPDRRSFWDWSGWGCALVGAVAHAGTKESAVHSSSRGEGGAQNRRGDLIASIVTWGQARVRSRAAGTASIRCISLRRGLASGQRRRGTLDRPSSRGGGAARGRRACLRIHDARVARTCRGSQKKSHSVGLSAADCAATTQREPRHVALAVSLPRVDRTRRRWKRHDGAMAVEAPWWRFHRRRVRSTLDGLEGPLRKSGKEMSRILINAGWPSTIPAHTL